jgi:ABC-type multidrug transport system ATPase subunit
MLKFKKNNDVTVKNLIHYKFLSPIQIDILVEDLGLTAVRSSSISRLTHSEKQRLNVACQLLTQCSVLVLDQTTNNMDIFDTFFLVEYLRQWCSSRSKIFRFILVLKLKLFF